jgi:hypothetical protein
MIDGRGNDLEEGRALADITERLEREFPTADSDRIAELLAGCYRRTTGATVQHFRAVLAERETRARLRSEATDMSSVTVIEGRGAA